MNSKQFPVRVRPTQLIAGAVFFFGFLGLLFAFKYLPLQSAIGLTMVYVVIFALVVANIKKLILYVESGLLYRLLVWLLSLIFFILFILQVIKLLSN